MLLLWLKPILKINDIAQPHNWIPRPSVEMMAKFIAAVSLGFWAGLLFGVVVLVLHKRLPRQTPDVRSNAMLYQAIAFLLVPVGVAALSWIGPALFMDRYFLPSVLGEAVILTHVLDRILSKTRVAVFWQVARVLTILAVLAWPIYRNSIAPKIITSEWLDRSLPRDIPVLVEDANTFVPLSYYAQQSGRSYYYVLDWEAALHSSSLHATVQSKLMRNAKASGYGNGRILDVREADCRFDTFVVLDSPGLSWFEDRILNNSAFDSKKVGDLGFGDPGPAHVWLVRSLYRSPECLNH